ALQKIAGDTDAVFQVAQMQSIEIGQPLHHDRTRSGLPAPEHRLQLIEHLRILASVHGRCKNDAGRLEPNLCSLAGAEAESHSTFSTRAQKLALAVGLGGIELPANRVEHSSMHLERATPDSPPINRE